MKYLIRLIYVKFYKMTTVDRFNGIKVHIYNGEHRPSHIHAVYNEYEVLIDIENCVIYSGGLPSRQLKIVMAWLTKNSDWALALFYEANPNLR